jgi:hypothetical protein
MDGTVGIAVVLLIGAIAWLAFRLYPKAREKHEDRLARTQIEVPADFAPDMGPLYGAMNYEPAWKRVELLQEEMQRRRENQPMGPSAPTGLSAPTQPVPFGGRVGPEYLSGQIREESERALALIREHFPREKWAMIVENLPNADWDVLSRMGADLLGVIRWYPRVVSKHMTDEPLAAMFATDTINLISSCIDHYRRLAPEPDKDQALAILGFYLRSILKGPDYNEWAGSAFFIAARSFLAKVHKDRGEPP